MMNVKKYVLVFLLILMVFMGVSNVRAAEEKFDLSLHGKNVYSVNNNFYIPKKKLGTHAAFCISGMSVDAIDGATCTQKNSVGGLTDKQRSIIGQIINKGCGSKCENFGDKYYLTEVAIIIYLKSEGWKITGVSDKKIIDKAEAIIKKAKKASTYNIYKASDFGVEFSVDELKFTKSGDVYKSQTIKLTKIPQVNKKTIKLSVSGAKGAKIEGDYNSYYVTVPVKNVTSNVTITLKTGNVEQKELKVARAFKCNKGQNVVRLISKTRSGNDTISGTIKYVPPQPTKGKLVIKKTNEKGNLIQLSKGDPAKFNLFSNSNCTGNALKTIEVPITAGTVTVSDLNVGGYSIKETQAPTGYVADTTCHSVNITANSTSTINVENKSTCTTALEKSDKSISSLITLYKSYNKNGLLNFSNPSCTVINCNDKSDSSISCLSASKNSSTTNFNENNLSCYESALQDLTGNYIGFCKNSFTLSNKLGKTSFTAKSGRFLSKGNQAAFATSSNICYILNNKEFTVNEPLTLEACLGDNDGDEVCDKLISTSSNSEATTNVGGFKKVIKSIKYNFFLNKVYLEKISGKVRYNESEITIEEQGLIIPFNSPKEGFIPFEVVYGDETLQSTCPYTSEKEIIKYPTSNPEGKLDLEFRTIDTLNPFPGKSGTTRNTGSNWCSKSSCSGNYKYNSVIEDKIINKNNSYNKNNASPMYVIELTSNTIKEIRNYNKDNLYDSYELVCDENNNCKNAFFTQFRISKVN